MCCAARHATRASCGKNVKRLVTPQMRMLRAKSAVCLIVSPRELLAPVFSSSFYSTSYARRPAEVRRWRGVLCCSSTVLKGTCRVAGGWGEAGQDWPAGAAASPGHKDRGLRSAVLVFQHINPSVRFYRRKLCLLCAGFASDFSQILPSRVCFGVLSSAVCSLTFTLC